MRFPWFRRKRRGGNVSWSFLDTPSGLGVHEKLQDLSTKVESAPFNPVEHLDKKRAFIAIVFVFGFLALLLIVIVGVPIYNAAIGQGEKIDLNTTLSTVGGLLGTPLGFVVGYYFKESKKK